MQANVTMNDAIGQSLETAEECELSRTVQSEQAFQKQASEQARQHPYM